MVKVIKNFISTMNYTPKLNFPNINLRAKEDNGHILVYNRIRSMYIVLTPEEWVRRHLVEFLILHCKAPLRSIVEEHPVSINGMAQRADVVVMDNNARPLLLAECKSPDIDFSNNHVLHEVFLQASRYNAILKARYVVLTNGIQHFCYECCNNEYVALKHFPVLG